MANYELDRRAFLAGSAASAAWALSGREAAASGGVNAQAVQEALTPSLDGHPGPPFSKAEYADRLRRVRERMAQDNIDMLLVTMPEGMCYLHGLQVNWYQQNDGRSRMLNVTAVHVDHDKLIHFDSHAEIMATTSVAEDIRPPGGGAQRYESVAKELKAEGWLEGTVGLEYWSYRPNPGNYERLKAVYAGHGCTLVDGSDVLSDVRVQKSPAEIAVMEEAGRICDLGLQAITDNLRPGVTELQMYGAMMQAMADAGGETAGLLQGVKAGGCKFLHGISSTRVIKAGDHVVADICGVKHRYHTNTCRGWHVGEPPAALVDIYKRNGHASQVLLDTAKAGTPVADLTRALRRYYKEVGVWEMKQNGDLPGWTGGYELGLSFPPSWVGWHGFSVTDTDVQSTSSRRPYEAFQERQISNYESFATGSTALIDTFVFEPDGARILTDIPAELIVVA